MPEWLKQRLEQDADALEKPVAEIVRDRLAAPYKEAS